MPASASSCSTTSRPASTGRCRSGAARSSATPATRPAVAALHRRAPRRRRSSISPPRSWCPNSVADPLGYYRNNTVNSRALIESAVKGGVQPFHLLLDRRGLRQSRRGAGRARTIRPMPMSPYGSSKLMTEIMLRDAGAAHGLALRDPALLQRRRRRSALRTGQSTKGATHLIKVAVETALGPRPKMEVFGTDYPTPDGTCIRDYIHVSRSRARAFRRARLSARRRRLGHAQLRLRPRLFGARGDRHGQARVRRRFPGRVRRRRARAIRRRSWRRPTASAPRSAGSRSSTISPRSSRMRSPGSASSRMPAQTADARREAPRDASSALEQSRDFGLNKSGLSGQGTPRPWKPAATRTPHARIVLPKSCSLTATARPPWSGAC